MRIGTPYFIGIRAAYAYYLPYGFDRRAVNAKLNRGEIHTGPPPLRPGEKCQPDEDGRHWIDDGGP